MQELRKNNTNIPLEVVNYPNIPLEYLTAEGERAILKGYERGLRSQSLDTQVYPSTNEALQPFKRTEILLNPVSVESARTWFMALSYLGLGLGVLAGGGYLLVIVAGMAGLVMEGLKMVMAALLIVPLAIVLFIILRNTKMTKTIIHEHQGGERTINKTYNQYNDCKF